MTSPEILEAIREKIRNHPTDALSEAQGTYLLVLYGEDPFYIAVQIQTGPKAEVSEVPDPMTADATAAMSRQVFEDLLNKRTTPAEAFMAGHISVDGDLGKALRLYALMA